MVIPTFSMARLPKIEFGNGKIQILPNLLQSLSVKKILLVIGHNFHMRFPIASLFQASTITYTTISISGEPTPQLIDDLCQQFSQESWEAVVAIGGGSVIDAGKAISAMLYKKCSVIEYLEGIGKEEYTGPKVPFVAIPTTPGTGSEVTKNAVLSQVGSQGFKRSLRHDLLIPDIAILDPELTISCLPHITAACGMDTLTQLIEAYVSTKANPLTDTLSISGIASVKMGLLPSYYNGKDVIARGHMLYSAFMSGVVLANVGLGIVHGFASSMGGLFNIPHGVICGTLLASATRHNIKQLQYCGKQDILDKYARVGHILMEQPYASHDETTFYTNKLIKILEQWTEEMSLPKLQKFGVTTQDIAKIVLETDCKNNPIPLSHHDMASILEARI